MPQTDKYLRSLLHRLDGKSYPAYKDLTGSYQFDRSQTDRFTLFIDHVQGDPFAAPSRLRASVPMAVAHFEADHLKPRSRLTALRDFLARSFALACQQYAQRGRGSGKSGLIAMALPGQEILERTSVIVTADYVEARFVCGLPAKGRRILGRQAAAMLCEDIPEIVSAALCHKNLDTLRLKQHLDTAEDADYLRQQLTKLGLVAFIADGAVLPRRSGVDHRPLNAEKAVPFRSPDSLRVTVNLPHAGQITGMGLPKGVTLIIGGGYHGKSTLLAALAQGVYTHIPGDGRHQTVTQVQAVKIRAEDGRRVEGVDLRPFINNLPDGQNTATFRTANASGSTSQAANIMEALEIGSQLLLLDEDTCATNLMIRDVRMQTLVEKSGEPITPFLDRVRQLAEEKDISSILVLGGSGDYFDVADTVIRMDAYRAYEVTTEAKSIAAQYPTDRQIENIDPWPTSLKSRRLIRESLDPSRGKRSVNIKGQALRAVVFGQEEIDVSLVAQLVDAGQVKAIGQALNYLRQFKQHQDIPRLIEQVMLKIEKEGLDIIDTRLVGDYVAFRPYELVAALNRLRTLQVKND